MRVLCIGDICGEAGMACATRTLAALRREYAVDFVVANGENAQGRGITPDDCHDLYNVGVDVITLGNHAFGRREIAQHIEDDRYLLRPANFTDRAPGKGYGVFDATGGRRVAVINLIGRLYMDANHDNPFFKADAVLKTLDTPIVVVDFHAEATSEKLALLHHLDGRVSAIFGTHTHVVTADERVTASGTGYITDVGMCGPTNSILGLKPEVSLSRFVGEPWNDAARSGRQADGDATMQCVLFDIDNTTGRCTSTERLEVS